MYFHLRNRLKQKPFIKTRVFNKLSLAPHRKGLVLRVVIITPKKPNSALRHVAKVTIYKNIKRIFGRIPGIGYLPVKFNRVLVRGGRANDLPSVRLTLVRNIYDFSPLSMRKRRRSIYGVSRPSGFTKHKRRRYRHLHM
uniref:30S ribosomal protein S12 n=1 Tax=Euplotes vanleeuwenhoeki TaxID=2794224 RepID=A0A7T1C510_9SPIT|nr:30S ribosomal protein S12 [Euplotes vanleeuwenhoeki]QPM99253.1 30S ribosomal protein S12 [Euplotes vanleeuwenhoeki]